MLNSTRDDMDSTAYTSTWKEGMQTQSSTFLTQRVPPESDPATPRTPRGLLTSRRMVSKPNIYLWYPAVIYIQLLHMMFQKNQVSFVQYCIR